MCVKEFGELLNHRVIKITNKNGKNTVRKYTGWKDILPQKNICGTHMLGY